ncbi:MAG: ABC transporter ATP-binding protein, partial [Actinomycetota bacterium]|nr:ABC transporter ATP-binding protein [Actinomycetota bacterium]
MSDLDHPRTDERPDVLAPPLLELDGLTVRATSRAGTATLVDGLAFQVERRETVALVGEPGSGKRVAMRAVLGLVRGRGVELGGSARLAGDELVGLDERALRRIRGGDVALVPSDPESALTPSRSVGHQVTEQLRAHGRASRRAARDRVLSVLAEVGIGDPARCADSRPHELSLPTAFRALIALAISCEPRVVVVDWPAHALDATSGGQVLDLLRQLQDTRGLAYVVTTRDLPLAGWFADRVVVVHAGRPVETGPGDAVLSDPLHPYTWSLVADLPPGPGEGSRSAAAPGRTPLLGLLPGCAFAPRCAWRFAECDSRPPLTVYGTHRDACWLEPRDRARLRAEGRPVVSGTVPSASRSGDATIPDGPPAEETAETEETEPEETEPEETEPEETETEETEPEETETEETEPEETEPEETAETEETEPEETAGEDPGVGTETADGDRADDEGHATGDPAEADAGVTAVTAASDTEPWPPEPSSPEETSGAGDAHAWGEGGTHEPDASPARASMRRRTDSRPYEPPLVHGFYVEPVPPYPGPTDPWPAELGPAGAWARSEAGAA